MLTYTLQNEGLDCTDIFMARYVSTCTLAIVGIMGTVLSPGVSTSRHVCIISLFLRQRTQNSIECAEQQKPAAFGVSSFLG